MKYSCNIVVLVLLCLSAAANADESGLEAMKKLIHSQFPDVTQISTAELAKWLTTKEREPPLLLDVRSEKEYSVSHLPGAIRVDPDADPAAMFTNLIRAHPVVTYCSIGYRSSAMAQRMQKAGWRDVRNLEGSIFAWANEGRLLEADGKRVTKVHPYNRVFARMLKVESLERPSFTGAPNHR